ncbi:hypothetical protein DJ73_17570 [Halorubrum sp. Ea1]|nr:MULTISPECIES: FAD-binding domain-containing protein [unclassified Halorubrum]OYR38767.1 hypothetical protein DJ81_17240 [Halorubrum sp. Hd13]OYR48645.1 hypothetical protein DJ74_10240 [Halorubrum sp. Ea8]OYR49532.1 hypothetical protein DJ73_17570 [Halorubrum sp. Ea1]
MSTSSAEYFYHSYRGRRDVLYPGHRIGLRRERYTLSSHDDGANLRQETRYSRHSTTASCLCGLCGPKLVGYDIVSNWGNWVYQTGVGNDSRDNRFEVLSQGEYHDDAAAYIRTWLPELDGLPAEYAHRPWRLSDDEQASYGVELGVDYPRPVIDIERRYAELG